MAVVKKVIQIGDKPTDEVLKEISELSGKPIVFDTDCPELTDIQLSEFTPSHPEYFERLMIDDENRKWLLSLGNDYKKNINFVIKWAREHNCKSAI